MNGCRGGSAAESLRGVAVRPWKSGRLAAGSLGIGEAAAAAGRQATATARSRVLFTSAS
jgi:hypothetical protein